MKTPASTPRAAIRAALAALAAFACGLCITASAAAPPPPAAPGCTPLSSSAGLVRRPVDLGSDLVMLQALCYAEGLRWHEADPQDGRRNNTLHQRFDIYRPKRAPLTQALPLVIWAHPNGQTEQLAPARVKELVTPATQAGFAFMSIEFRHPVASQPARPDPTLQPRLDVPHTDIARAVQWARTHAQQLGIDPDNVFLLGQSRGSLAVLTALMPDQRDDGHGTAFRRASSRVNAVFAVQAQTSYDHARVRDTFVAPQDWPRFDDPVLGYPWFRDPGSALDEVSADDPPVMLRYERRPTDPQRVVPLSLKDADGHCPKRPDVPGCLDVHHPNFGLALQQSFDRPQMPEGRLVVQYEVPAARYFEGYVCFFAAHLVGAAATHPDVQAVCPAGTPVTAAKR